MKNYLTNLFYKWFPPFVISIQDPKLKQDIDFILHNLPPYLIKGIQIIEDIFDHEPAINRIFINKTMNALEIKREIGKFIFRKKRWGEQEKISQELLSLEMIDMDMFYEIYETRDHLVVYEIINSDVFALYYGNPTMDIDEIAIAINTLYLKILDEKNYSSKHKIENLVEDLFERQEKNKKKN